MSTCKKLYRIPEGKILGGVCAGLGDYFNIDPVVIRLLWVMLAVLGGCGILAYIIALLVVPKRPEIGPGSVHYE